jgi:activating signal cointegrator complex subunit 1
VVKRINHILDSVTDPPPSSAAQAGTATTEARDQALRALVHTSVDLARLLAVQKAEFRVWFPGLVAHQRTAFEAASMEDIGGEEFDEQEEGGGLAGREIWCVAFPGVIKRGDETGGQLQYRNVIVKARVLCRPE